MQNFVSDFKNTNTPFSPVFKILIRNGGGEGGGGCVCIGEQLCIENYIHIQPGTHSASLETYDNTSFIPGGKENVL